MAGDGPGRHLRVLAGDLADVGAAGLADLVRAVEPDVVLLRGGPRRLRWRTRCADLANRCGLVYAGGGEPALGNVIFTTLGVAVREAWCVQYPLVPGRLMYGAALVRVRVGPTELVVAGTRLSPHAEERGGQAAVLAHALAGSTHRCCWRPIRATLRAAARGRPWPTDGSAAGGADAGGAPCAVFVDRSLEVTGLRCPPEAGSAVVVDLRSAARRLSATMPVGSARV